MADGRWSMVEGWLPLRFDLTPSPSSPLFSPLLSTAQKKASEDVTTASQTLARAESDVNTTFTAFQRDRTAVTKVSDLVVMRCCDVNVHCCGVLWCAQKMFEDMIMAEVYFHARAIENLTAAYASLAAIDPDAAAHDMAMSLQKFDTPQDPNALPPGLVARPPSTPQPPSGPQPPGFGQSQQFQPNMSMSQPIPPQQQFNQSGSFGASQSLGGPNAQPPYGQSPQFQSQPAMAGGGGAGGITPLAAQYPPPLQQPAPPAGAPPPQFNASYSGGYNSSQPGMQPTYR